MYKSKTYKVIGVYQKEHTIRARGHGVSKEGILTLYNNDFQPIQVFRTWHSMQIVETK